MVTYMEGLERHSRDHYSNTEGKPVPPPLSKPRSGSASIDGRFPNYVPTDIRLLGGNRTRSNTGNGGNGGGGGGGGFGGGGFQLPHQLNNNDRNSGRNCDSGYGSAGSSRRFSSYESSSSNTSRSGSINSGLQALANFGQQNNDGRVRHPASSGGHTFGRSLSESSVGSYSGTGSLNSSELTTLYEQAFGNKKKK